MITVNVDESVPIDVDRTSDGEGFTFYLGACDLRFRREADAVYLARRILWRLGVENEPMTAYPERATKSSEGDHNHGM